MLKSLPSSNVSFKVIGAFCSILMINYFKLYRIKQSVLAASIMLLMCHHSFSQRIENVDFSINDNKLIVTYELVACHDKAYDIKLFCREGSKYFEAINISGDTRKQSCGGFKTIIWDVLSDRTDLKGSIQIEVKIGQSYSTKVKVPRTPLTRDYSYVGFLVGGYAPIGTYSAPTTYPSDNLESNGFNLDMSVNKLYTKFIGITGSFRFLATLDDLESDKTTYMNGGIMVGPLISFPISEKFVWDIRPTIGYSITYVTAWSTYSIFYSNYSSINAGAFTTNLGTTLRYNVGYQTNLLLSIDYLSTNPEFQDQSTSRQINTLGISLGIGYRVNHITRNLRY